MRHPPRELPTALAVHVHDVKNVKILHLDVTFKTFLVTVSNYLCMTESAS